MGFEYFTSKEPTINEVRVPNVLKRLKWMCAYRSTII